MFISIHAAREGGDLCGGLPSSVTCIFQSTPPVKAATILAHSFRCSFRISIHAAREGGDVGNYKVRNKPLISIHAAREGGDVCVLSDYISNMIFQSTPPVKAATQHSAQCYLSLEFQSTPPVKAATCQSRWRLMLHRHFNPRRP